MDFDQFFNIKRPSEEWCAKHNIRVIDPDGWDRSNFEASWKEKISEGEFFNRVSVSTIMSNPII